jgi:hypothetical protein
MTLKHELRLTAVVLALGVVAAMPPAVAGPFEAELGSDVAKVAEDVKIHMMNGDNDGLGSGKGLVPYLKALGAPPKRAALVSFYIWDSGNKKEKSYRFYNSEYTLQMDNTYRLAVNASELDKLATELHSAAIGPLKEEFAAVGMQLLTPAEFLDTPAKQAAFQATRVEVGGMGALMGFLQKGAAEEWQWGTPDGYRLIKLATAGDARGNNYSLALQGMGVGSLANTAGHDLATALGVDAVVIMYNVVQAESTSIRLRGSYMYMFGPNPVANSGQNMYYPGQQYSGAYLRTDVDFIKTDKEGKALETDYAGFGIVAHALGMRMAQHIKKKTG